MKFKVTILSVGRTQVVKVQAELAPVARARAIARLYGPEAYFCSDTPAGPEYGTVFAPSGDTWRAQSDRLRVVVVPA